MLSMLRRLWTSNPNHPLRLLSGRIKETDVLYGLHPIELALESDVRILHRLFYNAKRLRDCDRISRIVDKAIAKGVPVVPVSVNLLDNMARGFVERRRVAHQGVCADVEPLLLPLVHHHTEPREEGALWLMAVGLRDPGNLGNMLRTAYFMGVERVILATNEGAEDGLDEWRGHGVPRVSAVVSKSSGGVSEIFPPSLLSEDIVSFLELKKKHDWNTVASALHSTKHSNQTIKKEMKRRPTLLVVGGEGEGLATKVVEVCEHRLHVESGRPLHSLVDSLNVTVASAILIDRLRTLLNND